MTTEPITPRTPTDEEKSMWAAAAKNHLAQAREHDALAAMNEAVAEGAQIELDREKYKREIELTGNQFHRQYNFFTDVSSGSVSQCITSLQTWERLDVGKPAAERKYEIVFFSPGGSVIDGMALFDYVQQVRRGGAYVTTSCIGQAASMGGILLQAGDWRVMNRESWLMIHEAAFGAQGKTTDVEDRVLWVRRVQGRILDIFADRAKGSAAKNPISRSAIKRNWNRKDWWITSEEALEHGLIDEIR